MIRESNQNLSFEIVSTKVQNGTNQNKKYVLYNLKVTHPSGQDSSPIQIERRYTQFSELYNSLKNEQPLLMSIIEFPKKVMLGNFDDSLICSRSKCFEEMLQFIVANTKLTNSKPLMKFLCEPELTLAKELLQKQDLTSAYPILECLFLLLNKIFTDRSPIVLLCLVRLLGCGVEAAPSKSEYQKYAQIALSRYEGVSDSDLLKLYVPVVKICIKQGLNVEYLSKKILDLSKTGFVVDTKVSLLDEVDTLEKTILNY